MKLLSLTPRIVLGLTLGLAPASWAAPMGPLVRCSAWDPSASRRFGVDIVLAHDESTQTDRLLAQIYTESGSGDQLRRGLIEERWVQYLLPVDGTKTEFYYRGNQFAMSVDARVLQGELAQSESTRFRALLRNKSWAAGRLSCQLSE